MYHTPAYYRDISVKLASVLEDIGVNEHTVQMRRRLVLLREKVSKINNRFTQINGSSYCFGSQSEGTTTIGLESDYDNLSCNDNYIVLQDISKWNRGLVNLLMFQDEYTPPGFCMLEIPNNIPQFRSPVIAEQFVMQYTTRYADKNMAKKSIVQQVKLGKYDEHGPAFAYDNFEVVNVVPFRTLPNFVSDWLQQQLQKGRLTPDMKKYIESHPCYAVAAGCKGSPNEDLEWRISTSHAERCVMFSLNITQIQCYVMFKFMLKIHLKHPSELGLSSFMCKNILLLCIEDTDSKDWCPNNLLSLFRLCLLQLKHCVSEEYCPHFIMHENNLMAGKFKPEIKLWLLDKIQELYQDTVSHFCNLTADEVGRRLQTKLDISKQGNVYFENPEDISASIFFDKLSALAFQVHCAHKNILHAVVSGDTSFDTIIKEINHPHNLEDSLEQTALLLLSPLIYSSLGSVIASSNIEQGQPVSPKAVVWLSLGLDSDVTSGQLKLASVYYCTGDYSKAEAILNITEEKYDRRIVHAICTCILKGGKQDFSTALKNKNNLYGKDEHAIRDTFAYGIRFLPSEIHCVPKELQYEMFRSTKEDLEESSLRSLVSKLPNMPIEKIQETFRSSHGNKTVMDRWMNWAVVDSLPYMYYLQYKTYGHLQRPTDQKQALIKMVCSINTTGIIEHAETSMNLLGQCFEQENRHNEAFFCYTLSLKKRSQNNAASIHICRLLSSLISAE
jgi:hypothetical protein